MDVDRKTIAELALSVIVLGAFVAASFVASDRYATPPDATANATTPPVLAPQGGLVMVGIIAMFVLLMGIAGLWMYRMDYEE